MTAEEINVAAAEKMKEIMKKMDHEKNDKLSSSYVDKVQLGTEGWKVRYYENKFHIPVEDLDEFVHKIKQSYIEGL
jgi:5'-3' exoribonuclease 2